MAGWCWADPDWSYRAVSCQPHQARAALAPKLLPACHHQSTEPRAAAPPGPPALLPSSSHAQAHTPARRDMPCSVVYLKETRIKGFETSMLWTFSAIPCVLSQLGPAFWVGGQEFTAPWALVVLGMKPGVPGRVQPVPTAVLGLKSPPPLPRLVHHTWAETSLRMDWIWG